MDTFIWPDLSDRQILLGVSGGIAAYKAAELCRQFVRCGAQVHVAMTRAAQEFVGAATFAALSGRAVATELFGAGEDSQIGHIDAADRADVMVMAPATAHLLAQITHGLASDLLTTSYLAFGGPVVLAPAMNVTMWGHVATQANMKILRQRSHVVVGPGAGEMACGHVGAGRMAEPHEILAATGTALSPKPLSGKRVLVSAGPTRQPLDPVRFLSNRSTGKMGYAIAAEAAAQGATVTLVSGPTALQEPWSVRTVRVTTAGEMASAIFEEAKGSDLVVMAAAVADYGPAVVETQKLKKDAWGDQPSVPLSRTTDILATLVKERSSRPGSSQILVGFAAESATDSEGLDILAKAKLERKGCDLLVANDILAGDAGFASDTNRVVIYAEGQDPERVGLAAKRDVAKRLLGRVSALWEA